MANVLITGGAGFIGSAFTRVMVAKQPQHRYIVLDKLTYAGNMDNLRPVEAQIHFVHGDIGDKALVQRLFKDYALDVVVNFAAETHVDRSIGQPEDFIKH